MKRKEIIGLGYALLAVSLFSLSLPMTKWALEGYNPIFTATGRALIAGIAALLVLLIKRIPLLPPSDRKDFWITAIGAVFGWPILIALALMKSPTAPVAVISSIMPLTTAAIAVLRGHGKVSRQFWIAAITGTCILIYYSNSKNSDIGMDLTSDLLVIGAVIFSSFCYVQGAELTVKYPGWQVISWIVVMTLPINIFLTFLQIAIFNQQISSSSKANVGLLVIGFSSMYISFIPWYRGLKDAGTAKGAQVQQLQVFLTLLWSVLFFNEVVDFKTLICAILILASVSWAIFSRNKSPLIAR